MQWYIPITIIPGVALLVLSTSNFIIALATEIQLLKGEIETNGRIIREKIAQIGLLSKVMVALYLSIASFTLSGISLGLFPEKDPVSSIISATFLGSGLLFLLFALCLLILYGSRAVRIRKSQFEEYLGE